MKLNKWQQENLPKAVIETAEDYGLILPESKFDNDKDFWDCHGNWIIKHDACEKIADIENIRFKPPTQNMDISPNIALLIEGAIFKEGTNEAVKQDWSFGEACARNTKMGYWWAMAEKRGKDRVILKLINAYEKGLYSETEADDWNKMAQDKKDANKKETRSESGSETKSVSTEGETANATEAPTFDDDDIPF